MSVKREILMKKFTLAFFATLGLVLLSPIATLAQSQDPLIGTWNVTFTTSSVVDSIAITTFNTGGTAIGAATNGTNPSTQETVPLGKWANTGRRNRTFKLASFLFDTTNALNMPTGGTLSAISYSDCNIVLSSNNNSFTGSCTISFYTCSLTSCPGTTHTSGPVALSGTRF
jgi:hypothetical protein